MFILKNNRFLRKNPRNDRHMAGLWERSHNDITGFLPFCQEVCICLDRFFNPGCDKCNLIPSTEICYSWYGCWFYQKSDRLCYLPSNPSKSSA